MVIVWGLLAAFLRKAAFDHKCLQFFTDQLAVVQLHGRLCETKMHVVCMRSCGCVCVCVLACSFGCSDEFDVALAFVYGFTLW